MVHRTGRLVVTNRGIAQDAQRAMGGDLMNAIVELVTNSDDSYSRLAGNRRGNIEITVDRTARTLVVEDWAEGMSADVMEERLSALGGRTSDFEHSDDVRGLFGRGARDVAALGATTWLSTHDGVRSEFQLPLLGGKDEDWHLDTYPKEPRLKNGTRVTLTLRDGIRIPRDLATEVSRHFALRSILVDPKRKVQLIDGQTMRQLSYRHPEGVIRLDQVPMSLGKGRGQAFITLYEADDLIDENAAGRLSNWQYWRHSLLITSGRSGYEIFNKGSLFNAENQPFIRRLHGTVDARNLNQVIRDADKANELGSILDRDRKGLVTRHEYVKALHQLLEDTVRPHVDRLREQARQKTTNTTSQQMRKMLRDLGPILARHVQEESDEETTGPPEGPFEIPEGLSVVPARQYPQPGADTLVHIRYRLRSDQSSPPIVNVHIDDGKPMPVRLQPAGSHYAAQLPIDGRDQGSSAQLQAFTEQDEARAEITWQLRQVPVFEELQFEHGSYTLQADGRRRARLMAPIDYDSQSVRFWSSEHSAFKIEPPRAILNWNEELQACVASCVITGIENDNSGVLSGAVSGEVKTTQVHVREPESSRFPVIKMSEEYSPDAARIWGNSDSDGRLTELVVNNNHPEVARYLGPRENNRPGQHSIAFRTLLRELICHAVVTFTLSKRSERAAPDDILGEYERAVQKLNERTRDILVPDAEESIPT